MAVIWLRRLIILTTLVTLASFTAWAVPRYLDPTEPNAEKRARDRRWVSSSHYFLDRQACRWISLCGLHHLRKDPAALDGLVDGFWEENDKIRGELKKRATNWEDDEPPRADKKRDKHERRRVLKEIPDYVNQYAPLVHLYSGEEFWPSDIKEHVQHMTVYVDGMALNKTETPWSLANLSQLNKLGGSVVLRSNDDVEQRPDWLHSHDSIPVPFEEDPSVGIAPPSHKHNSGDLPIDRESTTWYDVDKAHPLNRISDPRKTPRSLPSDLQQAKRLTTRGHKPDADGYSAAPAVLVVVDKGSGIVDAFWFFFYSYNLGQTVLGVRFGNHVGDWEHCMVRFENGVPRGMYFSEHEGGQAYAWEAVEKSSDGRPIIYSAVGSHAMYPLPGPHPYIIPFDLLRDITDKGPLWDPALNRYAYHYDYTRESFDRNPDTTPEVPPEDTLLNQQTAFPHHESRSLVPAAENPSAPTSWFHFSGRWGDEVYSLADIRQWRLFGQYHYVTGPDGPKFKSLNRSTLCQAEKCRIAYELDPKGTWY